MSQSTTFAVSQKIVYPSQGVGKILEIKEKSFKNELIFYYVIYLAVSDMTVMVPVTRPRNSASGRLSRRKRPAGPST